MTQSDTAWQCVICRKWHPLTVLARGCERSHERKWNEAHIPAVVPAHRKQHWYRTWDRAHLTAAERGELRRRR